MWGRHLAHSEGLNRSSTLIKSAGLMAGAMRLACWRHSNNFEVQVLYTVIFPVPLSPTFNSLHCNVLSNCRRNCFILTILTSQQATRNIHPTATRRCCHQSPLTYPAACLLPRWCNRPRTTPCLAQHPLKHKRSRRRPRPRMLQSTQSPH